MLEPTKDEVVDLYEELKDQIDDPTPIIRKKSGLSFYNSSRFDLKRLKSDPNGLKMNFPNYLNGFSENVFQIIENFQLDKPVEKLLKNKKNEKRKKKLKLKMFRQVGIFFSQFLGIGNNHHFFR